MLENTPPTFLHAMMLGLNAAISGRVLSSRRLQPKACNRQGKDDVKH
jgi:hypothetical protein